MRPHITKTADACFAILRHLGSVHRSVGLRWRNAGWHSVPSDQSYALGDELCCSTCVFCVEVRPHHAARHTAALVERAGVHRVQAGWSGNHIALPYLAEEFHQSSAVEPRRRLRSASSLSLVIRRTRFQPSAIKLFRLLIPDCETLCRRTSRHRRQCLFRNV